MKCNVILTDVFFPILQKQKRLSWGVCSLLIKSNLLDIELLQKQASVSETLPVSVKITNILPMARLQRARNDLLRVQSTWNTEWNVNAKKHHISQGFKG